MEVQNRKVDHSLHAVIAGTFFCGVLTMLGLSSRSASRSERALGVISAGQRLITAHPIRQRLGVIVASGSFDLECSDVNAKGWFYTSVAGGAKDGKGRALIEARRDPGVGVLEWLGAGEVRPWSVSRLELEVDIENVDAALRKKREASVRAGYTEAGSIESVRTALLALGGKPVDGEEAILVVNIFPGAALK